MYIFAAYEKGYQLEKAFAIFEEQLDNGIMPDTITFSSLISACERADNVELAAKTLDRMHEQGLVGPPQMYHSVIAACGSRWEHALDTFLGMQCAGVEASSQSVNLLMASLCAGRQRDHAVTLFYQSASAGIALNQIAYTALIKLLSQSGDWHVAKTVYARMSSAQNTLQINPEAARYIVAAFRNGGKIKEADAMASHFNSMGIDVRMTTDYIASELGNAVQNRDDGGFVTVEVDDSAHDGDRHYSEVESDNDQRALEP